MTTEYHDRSKIEYSDLICGKLNFDTRVKEVEKVMSHFGLDHTPVGDVLDVLVKEMKMTDPKSEDFLFLDLVFRKIIELTEDTLR